MEMEMEMEMNLNVGEMVLELNIVEMEIEIEEMEMNDENWKAKQIIKLMMVNVFKTVCWSFWIDLSNWFVVCCVVVSNILKLHQL